MFGRKKKKTPIATTSGTPDVTMPLTPLNETISSSGSLQLRASAFGRKFTPRSFKAGRKPFSGLPLTPTMSPVSILDANWPRPDTGMDGPGGALDPADETDSFTDATHHSVTSLPTLSPTMAAIEARTAAMYNNSCKSKSRSEDSPTTAQNASIDKPERKRTVRGFSTFFSRKDTTSQQTDLSSNWLIDFKNLTIGKTIGHSSFGTVSQGKLAGTKVAVKTIPCDSPGNLAAFQKEAELNCKLRHPNIVLFMGICVQPTKVCLVTELMVRGNVRDLLIRSHAGQLRLDWPLRQQWALDAARGMAYLHSLDPPMIHRDLKTNNLLVDRGMSVKICDFGLSRFRSDKLMSAVGTVHFAAPEVLRNEIYTEKADLFSFGTVMWELYTRQCVFEGIPQIEVYKAVVDGNMPSVDEGCDNRYHALLKDCWSVDPKGRPTFREAIDRLSVLVDELDENW